MKGTVHWLGGRTGLFIRQHTDGQWMVGRLVEQDTLIKGKLKALATAFAQLASSLEEIGIASGEIAAPYTGTCEACNIEATIGTEEVPHPVDRRLHTCVEICEWCDEPVANGRTHGEGKCFNFDDTTHETKVGDSTISRVLQETEGYPAVGEALGIAVSKRLDE